MKVAQELLGLTKILLGFCQHSSQKHGCAFYYRISYESCLGLLGLTMILLGFYQHSTQKHGCAFGSRISQESCLGITKTYSDFTRILLAFNSEAWLCVWLKDFLGKLPRNYQDLLRFYQDFTSIQLRSMVVRLALGFPRKVAQELLGLTRILLGFYQHSTQKHGCAFGYRISQESCSGIARTY